MAHDEGAEVINTRRKGVCVMTLNEGLRCSSYWVISFPSPSGILAGSYEKFGSGALLVVGG